MSMTITQDTFLAFLHTMNLKQFPCFRFDNVFLIGTVTSLKPLMTVVDRSVNWLVGRSVFHNFLKGREVTLPWSKEHFFKFSLTNQQIGLVWGGCAASSAPAAHTSPRLPAPHIAAVVCRSPAAAVPFVGSAAEGRVAVAPAANNASSRLAALISHAVIAEREWQVDRYANTSYYCKLVFINIIYLH